MDIHMPRVFLLPMIQAMSSTTYLMTTISQSTLRLWPTLPQFLTTPMLPTCWSLAPMFPLVPIIMCPTVLSPRFLTMLPLTPRCWG